MNYQNEEKRDSSTSVNVRKKKLKNESADHIRQERLANQHQYQNEKNAYSSTLLMKSENFMLLSRVHLLFINQLWYNHSVITVENLRLSNPTVEKIFTVLTATGFLEGSERAQIYNIAPGERSLPLSI